MISDSREDAYKFIISVATVFSVLSVLAMCLVVPAMYSYVSSISDYSRQDFRFCSVSIFFQMYLFVSIREHSNKFYV